MATDVYVMPLWRYIADDFSSPLETALGVRTTLIGIHGARARERPTRVGFVRRHVARWRARSIVKTAERETPVALAWRDDGEVVYANQFRSGDTIRSYLWWRDRQDLLAEPPGFPPPHEDLIAFWQSARERLNRFPHLQTNNYWNGLFLPVDFPAPVLLEKELNSCGVTVGRPICSSFAAMRELERITADIDVPEDYMGAWQQYGDADAWVGVKMALHHLRTILRHSLASKLPVIFGG